MNKLLFTRLFIFLAFFIIGTAPLFSYEVAGRFEGAYLYHDGSPFYLNPSEPTSQDVITIKFRTKKDNASSIILHYGDKATEMVKEANDGIYDFYFAEIPPTKINVAYYFEIKIKTRTLFYSRRGIELKAPSSSFSFKIIPNYETPGWMRGAVLYQIFTDRFFNGNTSNDVLDNEYMYDNWPSKRVTNWSQYPDSVTAYAKGSDRTREFFGGDLDGVIQKLDYLKDLGIDGIYFNPIFVSPSDHKYDTQDYDYVDPHFGVIVKDGGDLIDPNKDPNYKNGTFGNSSLINKYATKYIIRTTSKENLEASNRKLKELIDKAHAKGIKIILDGVLNHSGSFNKWLDREQIYPESDGPGAYEAFNSPFHNYYQFASNNQNNWPNNESYEAWYGFKTLPKLNYEGSPELVNSIMNMASKWVGKDYGIDGWRIDVAADLGHSTKFNHTFFKMLRQSVKTANPNAVVLAEVYGDSSSWLDPGDEWDTVMNYDAFFEPVSWFLTGLEKHSFYSDFQFRNNVIYFDNILREKMAKLPYQSLMVAMNELDNHDHSRFLTRTSSIVDADAANTGVMDPTKASIGINNGIMKEGVILQMTLPGAPTLYYGDEAGLPGWTDPDDRRGYPWGKEDKELLSFYKDIIKVHKKYSSFIDGSFQSLVAGNDPVYAYMRWNQENKVFVAINNDSNMASINIPVDSQGLKDGDKAVLVFTADKNSHAIINQEITVESGSLTVDVPAFGGVIIAYDKPSTEIMPIIPNRPVIKTVFPANNAKNIGLNQQINITFSEDMNARDIVNAFMIEPSVKGIFHWNGETVVFVPGEPMKSRTKYTVTVNKNISAVTANIFLKEAKTWTFTTK